MRTGTITFHLWVVVLLPSAAAEPLVNQQELRLRPDSLPLLADWPGTLSFRVRLSIQGAAKPELLDRTGAHVWVIPFESEAPPTLAGTLQRLCKRLDPGQVPADFSKIWRGVWEARVRKSVENSP